MSGPKQISALGVLLFPVRLAIALLLFFTPRFITYDSPIFIRVKAGEYRETKAQIKYFNLFGCG
jgi:hypothetical protein